MSAIKSLVKSALHDAAVIDNGISDKIADKIEPIIAEIIDTHATKLSVSAQCLEGLLANEKISVDLNREEMARMAMSYADELIKQLKKKSLN